MVCHTARAAGCDGLAMMPRFCRLIFDFDGSPFETVEFQRQLVIDARGANAFDIAN